MTRRVTENDEFVYLLWEDESIPFECETNLIDIFHDKNKADEECRRLNDESNRDYQEELRSHKARFGTELNIKEPRFSYYVNQWNVK